VGSKRVHKIEQEQILTEAIAGRSPRDGVARLDREKD
jgi:hypothetical protein